jgi:hypothetical protein
MSKHRNLDPRLNPKPHDALPDGLDRVTVDNQHAEVTRQLEEGSPIGRAAVKNQLVSTTESVPVVPDRTASADEISTSSPHITVRYGRRPPAKLVVEDVQSAVLNGEDNWEAN